MLLDIKGSRQPSFDGFYSEFGEFVCEKLVVNKRIVKNICIDLEFNDEIHRTNKVGKAWVADTRRSPREFGIMMGHGVNLHRNLIILGHELTHVAQWVNGELKHTTAGRVLYRGTVYGSDISYYDQPWEVEAHGREKLLVEEYAKQFRYENARWLDSTIV